MLNGKFVRQSGGRACRRYRNPGLMVILCLLWMQADASSLVDPTRPDYYSGRDSSYLQQLQARYKLNSMILGAKRRSAVINGEYVKEGERIGEALVRRIDKSGVKMELQGVQFTIALSENNFKQRQKTK